MRQLGIRIIPASSPQAKGRIERNHGTHQDRLVKKLRRKGIADLTAANVFWRPSIGPSTIGGLPARRPHPTTFTWPSGVAPRSLSCPRCDRRRRLRHDRRARRPITRGDTRRSRTRRVPATGNGPTSVGARATVTKSLWKLPDPWTRRTRPTDPWKPQNGVHSSHRHYSQGDMSIELTLGTFLTSLDTIELSA